jgi:hypothetical protein
MKAKLILLASVALAVSASAEIINGIDFVSIGSAGFPGDTDTDSNRLGYGAVGYNYKISQFEISFAQFALSGVGNGDENHWVGSLGSNAPVVEVTWHEAARYANWLTSGDADVGAYTINGSGRVTDVMTRAEILADGGLFFVLPTEDEWYKAAYFTGSGYSLYANGTNVAPAQGVEANYSGGGAWLASGGTQELNNATYNMMGNVWEWTESLHNGNSITGGAEVVDLIAFRGGSYVQDETRLAADDRQSGGPTIDHQSIGMRVVAIPEPGTITLMGLSTVSLFATRTIRRRRYLGQTLVPLRRQPKCDRFIDSEVMDVYSEETSEETVLTLMLSMVKTNVLAVYNHIHDAYKSADKSFWNYMVCSHERRVARRVAFRTSFKKKALACFDAFLALIMK